MTPVLSMYWPRLESMSIFRNGHAYMTHLQHAGRTGQIGDNPKHCAPYLFLHPWKLLTHSALKIAIHFHHLHLNRDEISLEFMD
jgi:hypothetical protein